MSDASLQKVKKMMTESNKAIQKEKNLKAAIEKFSAAIKKIQGAREFILLSGNEKLLHEFVNDVFKDLIKKHSPSTVISAMRNSKTISDIYIDPLDPVNTSILTLKVNSEGKRDYQSFSQYLYDNPKIYQAIKEFQDKHFYGENIECIMAIEKHLKTNNPTIKELFETYIKDNAEKQVNLSSAFTGPLKAAYKDMQEGKSGASKKMEEALRKTQVSLTGLIFTNDDNLRKFMAYKAPDGKLILDAVRDDIILKKMDTKQSEPVQGKSFVPWSREIQETQTAQAREEKKLKEVKELKVDRPTVASIKPLKPK